METITLDIPETMFRRLEQTAMSAHWSVQETILHSIKIGSPPTWDDVPAIFQPEIAQLDRLGNEKLWHIAQSKNNQLNYERYDDLLSKNQNGEITAVEKLELAKFREKADCFMLRKAHAAALLRWRGHAVPQP